MKFLIDAANARFGSMGERVLAFARTKRDPKEFKKSGYPFDFKNWKSWKNVKEHDHSIPGWFPMHKL